MKRLLTIPGFRGKSSLLWKGFLLAVCLMVSDAFLVSAQTQGRRINGRVTDIDDNPLTGVFVQNKTSQKAVITDVEGLYELVAASGDVLEFSFLGMQTQTVNVADRSVINVRMEVDAIQLESAVVIGYGSARKQDLTGAIGSVSSETIARQPVSNAAQSMQGQIAGINIIASDSPGSTPSVVIRGLGTALGGRNPLYIVDGFPADNINNISPSDIESMSILKDASSASIYGLRAANGVIIVTTKRGAAGKVRVEASSYIGMRTTLNRVKMANAEQYITYFNEYQQSLIDQGKEGYLLAPANRQPANTNWYDELLKTGLFNENTVSVSGGGRTVDYFVSYNYYDERGILKDQSYKRSTIRANNVYKLFGNRLKISQNFNVSYSNEIPKPYGAFDNAYRQSPLVPAFYDSGRYGTPYVNKTTGEVWNGTTRTGDVYGSLMSTGNPLLTVAGNNEKINTFNVQGGFEGELQLTEWLKANSRIGVTQYYYKNRQFSNQKFVWLNSSDPTRTVADFEALKAANPSSTAWANNNLRLENSNNRRWTWESFLTFDRNFGDHWLNAVAGISCERSGIGDLSIVKGYDVPSKSQYWNISNASSEYPKEITQYSYTPRALASYFGRLQYNYKSKYYLTATLRRDGTSAFKASGKKWGTFPSIGLGWTVSEEEFMAGNGVVDYLKLRASWGKLGNQDVPVNVSQVLSSTGSSWYNYSFGFPPGFYQGAALAAPAKGLTWEKTDEWNAGLDARFLSSRLTATIDLYSKTNSNTILLVNSILNSPYQGTFYDHGAKVTNRGLEVTLSWRERLASGFTYGISANYAYNRNRVKSVSPAYDGDTGGSLNNGQITKRLAVGQPIYGWWLYEAEGVWQTQNEINDNTHLGEPSPGHLRYKDQNGDGVIDDRDKVYFGSYLPTSIYGVSFFMDYRNFDFSLDGYGVAGNKVYNGLKNVRIENGENIARKTFNQRWTGPGSTNRHPGANRDSYASSYYLENGAYFRINNITLGYTFKNLVERGARLRLYFTAQNPFMFKAYSGFTPEINSDGRPNGTTGIELSAYPSLRSFLFGVNLSF